jgi:hypothetical protein
MPDAPSPSKVAAMRSGTLIGVAVPEIVHSLRTKRNAGSLADDDQRTLHGYVPPPPASAPTAPLGSDPSVVAKPGTLIQVRDARGGSPAADATQRIGSAWQESPHGSVASFGGQDRGVDQRPSGVLDSAPNGAGAPAAETWPSRDSTGASDDAAPLTSRAPASAGMPLRYLGIALLTVVAYFAWLYLLDHL